MVSTRQQSAFILLVAGSVMMHFYLYNVDLNPQSILILYGGIALQVLSVVSVSLDMLRKSEEEISISFYALYVFGFALSQTAINLARFPLLPGTDLLAEVNVAQQIMQLSHWDFSLASEHRYMSSLAVTVLPVAFANITGIKDMYLVFGLINTLLVSLIPILLILLVNRFFRGNSLAIFSAILVVQNYFFYYTVNLIMKSTIAYTLLLLGIIGITYKTRGFQILGILMLSMIVLVHYTVGILAFFFLTAIFLFRTLLGSHNIFLRPLNFTGLSFAGLVTIGGVVSTWLIFVSSSALASIMDIISSSSMLLTRLTQGSVLAGQDIRQGAEVGYITSAPAGPVLNIFFVIQSGLMLLGGLILFATLMNERIKIRYKGRILSLIPDSSSLRLRLEEGAEIYILAGLCILALLAAWFILPVASSQFSTFRMVNFSLITTPFFMAAALYKLLRPATLRVLKVLAIVFLLLMLPMNMMIPNQERNVIYHPVDSLNIEKQLDVLSSEYQTGYGRQVAAWMTKHMTTDDKIRTDAVGRYVIKTLLPVNTSIQWDQSDMPNEWPKNNDTERSFLVNGISLRENVWIFAKLQGRGFIRLNSSEFFSEGKNLIYNSGEFYLFQHSSGTNS